MKRIHPQDIEKELSSIKELSSKEESSSENE